MIEQTEAIKTYELVKYSVVLKVNNKEITIYYSHEEGEYSPFNWDYDIDEGDSELLTEDEEDEISDFFYSNKLNLDITK